MVSSQISVATPLPTNCYLWLHATKYALAKALETAGREGFLGGRTRARNCVPMIKTPLLYQLRYAPGTRRGKAFARERRLAKRPPDVQQGGGVFPGLGTGRKAQ